MIQDDKREKELIEFFQLTSNNSRIGVDATWGSINFELKTRHCVTKKTGISTSRDVGLHTLEKWRKLYWIISLKNDYKHIYLLTPSKINEWINLIENKLLSKHNLNLKCLDILKSQLNTLEYEQIQKTLKRGITLNDPLIPEKYILENGIQINNVKELRNEIMKDKLSQYFEYFENKNLEGLESLFADDVKLKDWEISASGKAAVLSANNKIFKSVNDLKVDYQIVYENNNEYAVPLLINLDGNTIYVLDVITFNENGLIQSVVAYKG